MVSVTLPEALYAEVAPLPIPLAQHLYHYWLNKLPADQDEVNLSDFLRAIQEKRQSVYAVMDSFVRNREFDQSPRRLRYSTLWLRETLGQHTPNKKPIPSKTFDHWVANNLIRNTRKGQPTPDSGAALCIVRMIIEGTKVLPGSMPPDTPPWICYAQDTPAGQRYLLPITEIERLNPAALLWTPWPGAAWDSHWMLLSDPLAGEYFGAIRYAKAVTMHGATYYNVTKEDILSWVPDFAGQFKSGSPDELQAVARLALVQLAEEGRIPTCSF
jgi:hypothetical protein